VYVDSVLVLQTPLDSARIGGLTPASRHLFQVARRDCIGGLHPGPVLTVTTATGSPSRPAAPSTPYAGARTNSSIQLIWTAAPGTDRTVGYAVYDGSTRVARTSGTSVTVTGLWRDTTHLFTVAALDAAGNESAGSAAAAASTLPCDQPVPAPTQVTATAVSASSVALSWISSVQATSYTVYAVRSDGTTAGPVASPVTNSAMITGLRPATTVRYRVTAQVGGGCGESLPSATVTRTTRAGAKARPAAATGLRVVSAQPNSDNTGTVTLGWTEPAGTDRAVAFRVYEGSTVLATATAPVTSGSYTVALRLPSGPAHAVTVAAVDAAGNEATQSAMASFTVPYIPVP
jgi:chitodextrinase